MYIKHYNKLQSTILSQDENTFFSILYDSMAKPILSLAAGFQLSRKTPLTEQDVLQRVFAKILEKGMSHFAGLSQKHFEGYLLRMTRNYCINCLRGQGEIASLDKYVESSSPSLERGLSYDMDFDSHDLKSLVDALPHLQQRIIQMRLEGFLFQEVAESLHIGISNVKYHYGKALDRLKRYEQAEKQA